MDPFWVGKDFRFPFFHASYSVECLERSATSPCSHSFLALLTGQLCGIQGEKLPAQNNNSIPLGLPLPARPRHLATSAGSGRTGKIRRRRIFDPGWSPAGWTEPRAVRVHRRAAPPLRVGMPISMLPDCRGMNAPETWGRVHAPSPEGLG